MDVRERKAKVQVRNLTKSFGDLLVLNDISFDVHQGEFLCIVGPTGCGKTTFLNVLTKLIPATRGEIFIDGEPANPRKHNLSFVFQEPSTMPWKTVEENIRFGLEVKKLPEDEIKRRVDQVVELVGLKAFRHYYPRQLSASMDQRVVIARAFAMNPDLLLMDEPYGQLDIKLRYYLEDEVIRIWRELKSTVIFVTHNIEEAVYVAERILVLTPKPTTIKSELKVDLPRPRNFADPEFVRIREAVTEMIKWW
ncbi:ABC transporter ATP-binding protein [Moorella naiadis]|uniref:ABC transporter ATP-binding protein n=1 Tax=Moorella naiadis (nom. illeg.) TaxID=3093670 RepID=UPI003D9CA4A6